MELCYDGSGDNDSTNSACGDAGLVPEKLRAAAREDAHRWGGPRLQDLAALTRASNPSAGIWEAFCSASSISCRPKAGPDPEPLLEFARIPRMMPSCPGRNSAPCAANFRRLPSAVTGDHR